MTKANTVVFIDLGVSDECTLLECATDSDDNNPVLVRPVILRKVKATSLAQVLEELPQQAGTITLRDDNAHRTWAGPSLVDQAKQLRPEWIVRTIPEAVMKATLLRAAVVIESIESGLIKGRVE